MDNLMQGIWIINARQQETDSASLTDYVMIFILILLIITFFVFILEFIILSILEDVSIDSNIDNDSYKIALIVGFFVSIMLSVIITPKYLDKLNNEKHETVYDIIIGDEVRFNDFNEYYEIIDQNGNIYTVREKNNGSNVCK